jgi:hypothetical protein
MTLDQQGKSVMGNRDLCIIFLLMLPRHRHSLALILDYTKLPIAINNIRNEGALHTCQSNPKKTNTHI